MEDVIIIRKVREPFGWLGNMSDFPVTDADGTVWKTTEALFQALRFPPDHHVRKQIHWQSSPMGAKIVAKQFADHMVIEPRSRQDVQNMEDVLRLKLVQHPALVPALQSTGTRRIVEDCSKRRNDSGLFWGAALIGDEWVGLNALGKLWEHIRSTL